MPVSAIAAMRSSTRGELLQIIVQSNHPVTMFGQGHSDMTCDVSRGASQRDIQGVHGADVNRGSVQVAEVRGPRAAR